MMKIAPFAVMAAVAALVLGDAPVMAAPAQKDKTAQAAAGDKAAQSRSRARTQVRVTPRYPYRNYHSPYPVPYAVEYPGPNGVRHCTDRYVVERRPSGTVLVPRMNCVWVVRR